MQAQSDDESLAEGDFAEGASSWQPEQRAVRHIRAIQVRNFTPFPARDTFASTVLRAHSTQVQSAPLDDTDATFSRRRSRKISANSSMALRHLSLEDSVDADSTPRAQRSNSRTNASAVTPGSSPTATRRQSISTMRRGRPRTASHSSTLESTHDHQLTTATEPSASTSSALYASDTSSSQRDLEDIISSRLIPTFLIIDQPLSPLDRQTSLDIQSNACHDKSATLSNPMNPNRDSRAQSTRRAKPQFPVPRNKVNGSASPACSPDKPASSPSSPATPLFIQPEPKAPVYMSSFHMPSTNPIFDVEMEGTNLIHSRALSIGKVRVQLWGQVETTSHNSVDSSKGKSVFRQQNGDEEWKVFCTWDVDISRLVPLPSDLEACPSKLPSNTLLVKFVDSRSTFYLPHSLLGATPEDSTPTSPDYNSDSEVTAPHRRKPIPSTFIPTRRRTLKKDSTTSSYQDLVKLATLQGVIADSQITLDEVVRNCDGLLEADTCTLLRREAAEKEYHLRKLQEHRDLVDDDIGAAQDEIRHRKEQLQRRRRLLAEARVLHENDLLSEFKKGSLMAEERHRISSLKSQITPMRTSLLSNLAYIFPIELLSPPELLFTILNVPLPIPATGSDPAPPLSLSSHNEVTEDGVSTALGYAALLVHLTATYLSRLLTYPITFVGSRSLIKDPISSMVGPRMFPLYSKGVDTYRFEYAVFLLNKNIELLMADRELRALDMRQTLPNLKNLLLTLTSGEVSAHRKSHRPLPSPSIASGLRTPTESTEPRSVDSSPPPLDLSAADAETAVTSACSTPKQASSALPSSTTLGEDDVEEEGRLSASTAGGGTASRLQNVANLALRPKVYLGFAPLTSMFRRTASLGGKSAAATSENIVQGEPSQHERSESDASNGSGSDASSSTSPSTDESEDSTTSDEDGEDLEDDRRTIRGVSAPVTPVEGSKFVFGNGKGPNEEKPRGGAEDGAESGVDAVAVFVST